MNEEQQTIEEWLDEKIAAYELLGKEFNPTGKQKYWECPRVISIHTPDKAIHVNGLDEIISLLPQLLESSHKELKVDDSGRKWHEFSFVYKEYTFFEVYEEEK